MKGIRLVSWDVDGTLFSHVRLLAPLIRQFARCGMESGWRNSFERLHETWKFHRTVENQRQAPNSMVLASELEPFENIYALERRALDKALQTIRPRSRALAMLRRFSSDGVPQVALSDFECDYKLKALGIRQYFDDTYSCHSLGFWKPSPTPFAKIQSDFRVRPDQHLHIGDRRDTDGEACARNGCRFMLIDQLPRPWKTFNRICAISAVE